jgi:hypothetical protein
MDTGQLPFRGENAFLNTLDKLSVFMDRVRVEVFKQIEAEAREKNEDDLSR